MRLSCVWHTQSCRTCYAQEWVMSHMWMSHVAHVNESCRTCEWVMSVWMSHVAHANESYRRCEWVKSCVTNSFIYATLIHMCDACMLHARMSRTYEWVSHISLKIKRCMLHDPCIEWQVRISRARATWLSVSHTWESHIISVAHVNDVRFSCVWHTQSCCTCYAQEWVMPHMWMSHVARVNESCSNVMCDKLIHLCVSHSYVRLMYVTWFV